MQKRNDQITSEPVRAYMESAKITMKQTIEGTFSPQTVIRDDVLTVIDRQGKTMKEWAKKYFGLVKQYNKFINNVFCSF